MLFKKLNKKGQVLSGLQIAIGVMITLLVAAIVAFAVIISLGALNEVDITGLSSLSENATDSVLQNVSVGTASFFSSTTIWFSLLSIVIIILIVVLIVVAVQRLQGRGTPGI